MSIDWGYTVPPDEAGKTATPDPVEVAVAREPAEVDGADGTAA